MSDTRQFVFAVASSQLPAANWPAVGELSTVGVNRLDTQQTQQLASEASGAFTGVTTAWNPMPLAKTCGQFGALIAFGGGHSNGSWNGVYYFDIADLTWKTAMVAAGYYTTGQQLYTDSLGYMARSPLGEYWTSSAAVDVYPNEIAASHNYGKSIWLPPGSIGDDPYGYLYVAAAATLPKGGSFHARTAHYLPLWGAINNGVRWQRGVTFATVPAYGHCCYDSLRNRVAIFPVDGASAANNVIWFDNLDGTYSSQTLSATIRCGYAQSFYWAERDLYIKVGGYSGAQWDMHLVDPVSRVCTPITTSPAFSMPYTGGWTWVDEWQQLIWYDGRTSDATIHRFIPPANPLSEPWEYQTYSVNGSATTVGTNPHFGKLQYVDKAGYFLWCPLVSAPTQAFNIPRIQ